LNAIPVDESQGVFVAAGRLACRAARRAAVGVFTLTPRHTGILPLRASQKATAHEGEITRDAAWAAAS
jgi:hypothetical protein